MLVFLAHMIICAKGFILEDGRSPPQTLKPWLLEDGPSHSGFHPQRGQRRNFKMPRHQQEHQKYFDSYSPQRTRSLYQDSPEFHQPQRRDSPRNLHQQTPEIYQDSFFSQKGPFFDSVLQTRPQVRAPFDKHEIIDTRSPISKQERQQEIFWGNDNENLGYDLRGEHGSTWFGGGSIRDVSPQGYHHQSFFDKDHESRPDKPRKSKRIQQSGHNLFRQQNRAHGNQHEYDDSEAEYFLGESDYSPGINHGGNEEEIKYKSPFYDYGTSNGHEDEYYDFFNNHETINDSPQYYSLEVGGDHKSGDHLPDVEVDFSDDPDLSDDDAHFKDTREFHEIVQPTRDDFVSKEKLRSNSPKKRNPVRSLEALESQEYDDKKIKTIYTVSKAKDKGSVYPVITSVTTNIEEISAPAPEHHVDDFRSTRRKQSFEKTLREEKEEESRSSKQNRRGRGVEPSDTPHESRYSQHIESSQSDTGRRSRHIQNNHVPGYTKHRPEHLHITDGVPTYTSNVHQIEPVVISNPPSLHQTVEVHHQPEHSVVSFQSPPAAFVDVPQYVPGVHDLPHAVDPYQQSHPYLELNIPKHVKVRKIRKGYIYELHLQEEEHLTQKDPYYHTPGHH